jgi:hypothetical protein
VSAQSTPLRPQPHIACLCIDIVFLRAWVPVHPRKFYIPVTNLLQENKTDWHGMRRVGEVRREMAIKTPRNPDSEYKVRPSEWERRKVVGTHGVMPLPSRSCAPSAGSAHWSYPRLCRRPCRLPQR